MTKANRDGQLVLRQDCAKFLTSVSLFNHQWVREWLWGFHCTEEETEAQRVEAKLASDHMEEMLSPSL